MKPPLPREKIGKVLAKIRPTTPQPEQMAAILAVGRILQSHDADWCDLVNPAPEPEPRPRERSYHAEPTPPSSFGWRMTVRQLLVSRDYLSQWEQEFLTNLLHFKHLSDKQQACLTKINGRVRGGRP